VFLEAQTLEAHRDRDSTPEAWPWRPATYGAGPSFTAAVARPWRSPGWAWN